MHFVNSPYLAMGRCRLFRRDGSSRKRSIRAHGPELAPIFAGHGARVICSGAVNGLMIGECDPLWDAVSLVESAEYEKVAVHRTAGLEGQLNIQTKAPVTNRRVG